jgi:elongation factor P
MFKLNQVKIGSLIELDNAPYQVLFAQHSKLGRGGAILRSKLKNLLTGAIIDKTFKGEDKLEEAQLDKSEALVLYKDKDQFHFMDQESFDQFSLTREQIGKKSDFLLDGAKITILSYNEKPISIDLPIKMDFKVIEADPGVKGATASAVLKNATLESGATIRVPVFIKEGDVIRIDTRDGKYVERVKE